MEITVPLEENPQRQHHPLLTQQRHMSNQEAQICNILLQNNTTVKTIGSHKYLLDIRHKGLRFLNPFLGRFFSVDVLVAIVIN
jgi:hypothetical protein